MTEKIEIKLIKMNKVYCIYLMSVMCVFFVSFLRAQEMDLNTVYQEAMQGYGQGDYEQAAASFALILEKRGLKIPDGILYNGIRIHASNGQTEKAFELLEHLVNNQFYTDYDQLTTDSALIRLHAWPKWNVLVGQVAQNKETLPIRKREGIKHALLQAKEILLKDNGKLWGENIWNDSVLVVDFENTIYSLVPIPQSMTEDSVLYYKKIPVNTLSLTNTTQKYEGNEYATVVVNYLNDHSATIIHELFHLLHFKHRMLNGDPVDYLDHYDAREWLRLEYQALKNALRAIDERQDRKEVETYLYDALMYRKIRQSTYKDFLDGELQIETLEGLANYTGFVLSGIDNKQQKAIAEINQREKAQTYTRPFPYATGPAYGLAFDYLGIAWKEGLDKVYDFLDIYERNYLRDSVRMDHQRVEQANARNNYDAIHKEETDRMEMHKQLVAYYTDMFFGKPTLKVSVADQDYSRSFNMNGTLVLEDKGTVYSGISGTDKSGGNNFGNFAILEGKDKLGIAGVLGCWENESMTFVFPLPVKIEERKIRGECYEIDLNEGWTVIAIDDKGNLEIVRQAD